MRFFFFFFFLEGRFWRGGFVGKEEGIWVFGMYVQRNLVGGYRDAG